MKTYAFLSSIRRDWPRPVVVTIALLLWTIPIACGKNAMETVRIITTEPACFEYLFTSMVSDANGYPLLAFNHRSGRTIFAKPGDTLGAYRIAAYESRTNHVFHPSINAYLDEPAGRVKLAGPANAVVVLDQNKPLPWPGRVAWLISLENGTWWSIQEQDIFYMGRMPVFVEEIGEEGVMVTAGQDLSSIPQITPAEKDAVNRLWADQKLQAQKEQELALQRRREEAIKAQALAQAQAQAQAQAPSAPFGAMQPYYQQRYQPGYEVEIRGPSRFFYGTEYRFPASFKVCPGAYSLNGQYISVPCVIPASFKTYYSGVVATYP